MTETNNGLTAPMQLGSIGSEQLAYFSPLLLPDVAHAIERGNRSQRSGSRRKKSLAALWQVMWMMDVFG